MPENTAPVSDGYARKSRTRPKKARRITPDYLHNAALYYLERYAASSGRVRHVLTQKIHRSCRDHPDQDLTALLPLIDREIETLIRVQLLDDDRLAAMLVEGYRSRGLSARAIQIKMRTKGFTPLLINQFLTNGTDQDTQRATETDAAVRYLKRRKLWPYHQQSLTDQTAIQKERRRAWAALARQGYSPEIISAACQIQEDQ